MNDEVSSDMSDDTGGASPSPRRIVVVRHAKAVQHSLNDHERSLADRGRRDAPAAGRWLTGLGIVPDLVLCSTATRTRQTWKLLSGELERQPEVVFEDQLYGADLGELFDAVRQAPEEVRSLMVVGHNPGMHALADALAGGAESGRTSEDGLVERMTESGFPTSAVAVLNVSEVTGAWAELQRGSARLVEFWTPRG